MKQHVKLVMFPKGKFESESKQIVYRYLIGGLIVTDEPVKGFEGKVSLVIDGPTNDIVESFLKIKRRKPKRLIGDLGDAVLSLNDI